jgi:hypothetical protein
MRPDWTAKIVAAGLCLMVMGLAKATTTTGSLEPTTGTWRAYRGTNFATLVCSNSSEAAMLACIAADAERRATTTRYQLRYPNRYVTVTYARPTCPAAPAPITETRTCPAGTTGTWSQTGTSTVGPAPTCTVTVTWEPATPSAEQCVPIQAEQWTFCANEYQTCSFTGTRRVRFGLNTSWVERDLTAVGGGVPCRLATFGSDPVVGVTKRCELRALSTEPEPTVPRACTSRVCDVSWTPDGPADGYRIFFSKIDGTWANTPVQVTPGTVTQSNVTMPETGIWYFAVKAFIGASESPLSNVVVRDVQ